MVIFKIDFLYCSFRFFVRNLPFFSYFEFEKPEQAFYSKVFYLCFLKYLYNQC